MTKSLPEPSPLSRRQMLAGLTALSLARPALAKTQHEWVLLGKRLVNFRVETDIVPVGLSRGLFSGLRVEVAGNAVLIESLSVRFTNGEDFEVVVRNVVAAGSRTRDILFPGLVRGIRHIRIQYRRVRLSDPASLSFYGRRER